MKKSNKVKIHFEKSETTVSVYTCPYCRVTIRGAGLNKYVTRFRCEMCGKELVVEGRPMNEDYWNEI